MKKLFMMAIVVFLFNNSWGQFTAPFAKSSTSDLSIYKEFENALNAIKAESGTVNQKLESEKEEVENAKEELENRKKEVIKSQQTLDSYKVEVQAALQLLENKEAEVEKYQKFVSDNKTLIKSEKTTQRDSSAMVSDDVLLLLKNKTIELEAANNDVENLKTKLFEAEQMVKEKKLEAKEAENTIADKRAAVDSLKQKDKEIINPLLKRIAQLAIDTTEIIAREVLGLGLDDSIVNARGSYYYKKQCTDSITKYIDRRKDLETTRKDTVDINAFNKEMNDIDEKITVFNWAKDFYDAVNSLDKHPKISARIAPTKSIIAARRFFYDKTDNRKNLVFINNSAIQSNLKDIYKISTEVVSGIFPFFTKRIPIKFSLGTTIDQNNLDNEEEKVASKILSGGILRPSFTYPLFFSNNEVTGSSAFQLYVPLEVATNFDGLTEDTKDINSLFNFTEVSLALNLSFILSQPKMNENTASIFINGRLSYIDGGSLFYDEMPGYRHGFWVSQINFGLKIKNKYSIAFNIPVWSSNKDLLNNQSGTVALIID